MPNFGSLSFSVLHLFFLLLSLEPSSWPWPPLNFLLPGLVPAWLGPHLRCSVRFASWCLAWLLVMICLLFILAEHFLLQFLSLGLFGACIPWCVFLGTPSPDINFEFSCLPWVFLHELLLWSHHLFSSTEKRIPQKATKTSCTEDETCWMLSCSLLLLKLIFHMGKAETTKNFLLEKEKAQCGVGGVRVGWILYNVYKYLMGRKQRRCS